MNIKSITTLLFLNSIVLFAQIGYASWYGKKYQGKITASGEPFNMYDYTAANRTLPFGTIVKVTNLKNNKSVKVRINDRGPTKKSRIIDLSYQAAKEIGLLQEGIASVKIETLSKVIQKNSSNIKNNPYLTDEKSNQEYDSYRGLKASSNYSKHNSQVAINRINVQVASFSSRKNAKSFIDTQSDSGYKMRIIEVDIAGKILYKVVIVCNSSNIANRIIKSGRYSGAYILR